MIKAVGPEQISVVRQIGYSHMLLETIPEMDRAVTLYEAMGFRIIKDDVDCSASEVMLMELQLAPVSAK